MKYIWFKECFIKWQLESHGRCYYVSGSDHLWKDQYILIEMPSISFSYFLASSAGVFFERAICSRKRHVETSRREEEMGRVKGSGEGAGREKSIFFLPSPSPLSFFRPRTYRKGYYFYSPQSSTVIKSKMATTTILQTQTRFRPPKVRLHCRLPIFRFFFVLPFLHFIM